MKRKRTQASHTLSLKRRNCEVNITRHWTFWYQKSNVDLTNLVCHNMATLENTLSTVKWWTKWGCTVGSGDLWWRGCWQNISYICHCIHVIIESADPWATNATQPICNVSVSQHKCWGSAGCTEIRSKDCVRLGEFLCNSAIDTRQCDNSLVKLRLFRCYSSFQQALPPLNIGCSLRRLKTWLRRTMTQKRLTHLALLHCHRNIV